MVELTDKERKLLDKLEAWLKEAESSVGATLFREAEVLDQAFYALDQDSTETKIRLAELKRPSLVYDEIRSKIDAVVAQGLQVTEAPAMKHVGQEDAAIAELGRNALKHFRQRLHITEREHDCWIEQVKVGLSYMHFYVDTQNPFSPKLKSEVVFGRDCFKDPLSRDYEMKDARYFFRQKWVDETVLEAFYEGRLDKANFETTGASDKPLYFSEIKNQYRIMECWYRVFEKVMYFINPQTQKDDYVLLADWGKTKQAYKEIHQQELQGLEGRKTIVKYCQFTSNAIIEEGTAPYSFTKLYDYFPYVPYCGYFDANHNRYFGAITPMRDPQTMLNTLMRQLTHLLQTAPRGILMHEVGAILNIDEYEQRGADPTYHMEIAKGNLDKVKFSTQPQISPVYESLIAKNKQGMKDSSGIQDPILGIQTSSREPGITAGMRQDASLAVLAPLFYNYARSRRMGTLIFFSMVQQYINQETLIRVEGPEGEQLLQLNTQMNPQSEGFNSISTLEYDIEIDYTSETKTNKDFTLKLLSEFGMNNPGAISPDLLLEYTNLPMTVKQKVLLRQQSMEQQQQAASQAQQQQEQAKLELEKLKLDRDFQIKMMELHLEAKKLGVDVNIEMLKMMENREERQTTLEARDGDRGSSGDGGDTRDTRGS